MAVTANGSNGSAGETEDPRKIRLDRLAYVHYQHPDLSKAHRFLTDFGMEKVKETENRIYYRGFGAAPCIYVAEASPTPNRNFVGGAWVVESYRDLEDAAALPGASQIADSDVPGGGSTVTLKDPNGHNIMLVFGQILSSHSKSLHQVEMNSACVKPRVGVFQRFKPGPSPVHKLGHYGFVVRKSTFFSTREWYTRTFNLKVTDSVFDPESNVDETSFLHIDKGKEYTDHHSLFLAAGPEDKPSHIHHSSFEVHDMDTQLLGHDWLRNGGWVNCWGVGRHLLGSQIFDYWFDASGNVLEHYSDGDLVNIDTKVTREPAAPQTLFVWGPNIPLAFMSGRIEDAVIDNKLAITHPQLLEEPNTTVNKTSTTASVDVPH
ncbi:Glyoxalase/Bleomycin resistance protein/Dihydroxybiphenyl dioxygenase [Hyaloscypha bicolor E]|uniref:Glyoxalase/Bleomycin resistance protein/Dihydroxybiphenyl dioxygenase n=1 Tax=Hyaloscypha bicolor E TaxID=1095630 RepID=A0A2J6SJ02_9HELO|nr:Glyoxalase/Bleomycin resistance protein/Dihydroxybiphenyl dioxygenase [Hyaloscypha bicolor E]PMD50745.1 Glyoxalase/Bleomycin resistance protein/Dihydroxybiphenyl dioxygenase [Hyaloscypha bicolor E]